MALGRAPRRESYSDVILRLAKGERARVRWAGNGDDSPKIRGMLSEALSTNREDLIYCRKPAG
jgi:hypothetical protein